ncbi:hypothetical protein BU17DRAFT_72510 [Hysterangium stoloniferum]|nr:hypothetical protein BU17DRAFT_72510 [Hysterangium stoloniferum]
MRRKATSDARECGRERGKVSAGLSSVKDRARGNMRKHMDDHDEKEEEEDDIEKVSGSEWCSYATVTLEPVLEVLQDMSETWKEISELVQELVIHCEYREQQWAAKDSRRDVEGLGQQELNQKMVDWPGTTLSVMGRDRDQAIEIVDGEEEMAAGPPPISILE